MGGYIDPGVIGMVAMIVMSGGLYGVYLLLKGKVKKWLSKKRQVSEIQQPK